MVLQASQPSLKLLREKDVCSFNHYCSFSPFCLSNELKPEFQMDLWRKQMQLLSLTVECQVHVKQFKLFKVFPFLLNEAGKCNKTRLKGLSLDLRSKGWGDSGHRVKKISSSTQTGHRPCQSCLCPTLWWSWTPPSPSAWPGLAGLRRSHQGSPAGHPWMMLPCAPPLGCQMTRPSGCCFQVL